MGFKLFKNLSSNSNTDRRDVRNVKTFLGKNGYIEQKDEYSPYPDSGLFAGIKAFQKNKALKVDGVMNRGGETEIAMGMGRYVCPGLPHPYMDGCGRRHEGVYSTTYCQDCYIKGLGKGIV